MNGEETPEAGLGDTSPLQQYLGTRLLRDVDLQSYQVTRDIDSLAGFPIDDVTLARYRRSLSSQQSRDLMQSFVTMLSTPSSPTTDVFNTYLSRQDYDGDTFNPWITREFLHTLQPTQQEATSMSSTTTPATHSFSVGDFVLDRYTGNHYVLRSCSVSGDQNLAAQQVWDLRSMHLSHIEERLSPSSLVLLRPSSGFKVGDRVKVARRVDASDVHDAVAWNTAGLMDNTIGMIGRVCTIVRTGIEYRVCLQNNVDWCYPAFSLELCQDAIDVPVAPKAISTAYVLCAGVRDLDEVNVLGVYTEPTSVMAAFGIIEDCGCMVVPSPTSQLKKLAGMLGVSIEEVSRAITERQLISRYPGYTFCIPNLKKEAWVAMVACGPTTQSLTSILSRLG